MKAVFRIVSKTDVRENAAIVSRRWRESRMRFREDRVERESEHSLAGVRKFLATVNDLSNQRLFVRPDWRLEK